MAALCSCDPNSFLRRRRLYSLLKSAGLVSSSHENEPMITFHKLITLNNHSFYTHLWLVRSLLISLKWRTKTQFNYYENGSMSWVKVSAWCRDPLPAQTSLLSPFLVARWGHFDFFHSANDIPWSALDAFAWSVSWPYHYQKGHCK